MTDSDTFLLGGGQDLVPYLVESSGGDWRIVEEQRDGYDVRRYRPRVDGQFALIERWRHRATGETHWRTVSPRCFSAKRRT